MTNPNEPTKPKRRYTVTGRVLAACRINIEKARKAALERRFCATRGTWPEMQASHDNLEAAQRVKREDNTYKYCSIFRHGLLVGNLERSLVMAGESREEYQAHLARFGALPAVFAFDADSDQVKLAQACGFASWRRLRAFRLQSEWALRMMLHHLRKAIGARQTPSLSGEREAGLAGFGGTLPNLVISSAAQSGAVIPSPASFQRGEGSRSAAALCDSSFAGLGAPAAPPFDFTQGGQAASLTPEQFLELGRGLRWAAESWPGVWQPITRLNNRFDQLWCTLLDRLGEPVPSPNQYFLECAHMRWSPVVGRFDLYSAEVLGNPLLRQRRLEELLESRPAHVRRVKDWPCASRPYELQERWQAELRHREAEAERLGRPVSLMGGLDYGLLRKARKAREKSDGQQEPSPAVELPRTFEGFLALVEAAFGEGSETGDSGFGTPGLGLGARGATSGTGTLACACPEPRTPSLNGATPPTLRDLAQLLWDSATLHRRRAEEEARCLGEYLADYAARLSSVDPQDIARRRRVAAEILKLFRQGVTQQEKSVEVTRRARLALHDIAVERYGRRPEWDPQLLNLNDRFNRHRLEFFDLHFSRQTAVEDG